MKITRTSIGRRTGTHPVAESDALGTISSHRGSVSADARGRSGVTDYRYSVEVSTDELLSMVEKLCLSSSSTAERAAMVRGAIETLRALAERT